MKKPLKPGGHVAPRGNHWSDPEIFIPLDRLRIYMAEDIAELKPKFKEPTKARTITFFDDPAPIPTREQLKQLIHYEPMPESVKAEMKRGALETATHALDAFSYALNKFIKPLKKATIMDRNFQPNEEKTAEQKWTLTNANMLKQAVTRMETLEHELQNEIAVSDRYYREVMNLERVQASNEKRIGELETQLKAEINARHELVERMGATVTTKNNHITKMQFENEKLKATIKTMKKNRAR